MGFDYGKMQGTADRLLTRFNQGTVILRQITTGPSVEPGEPGPISEVDYPLQAVVRRVSQKYVDGSLIVATDDQMTFAVPPVVPSMADIFIVDGRQRVVKDIRPIPGAGTVVAYIVFLAS